MNANCTFITKISFKKDNGNSNNLLIEDHHLIKKHQKHVLSKVERQEIYIIHVSSSYLKPPSIQHFEKLSQKFDFDWINIYLLLRVVAMDSKLRAFQYKILHNVLYLNKRCFKFQKVSSPLCPFCNEEEETINNLFQ